MKTPLALPAPLPPALDAAPSLTPAVALYFGFEIKGQPFCAAFKAEAGEVALAAAWRPRAAAPLALRDLTEHFGVTLPACMDWRFTLEKARLRYQTQDKRLAFTLAFKEYAALTLASASTSVGRDYALALQLDTFFSFADIPVFGRLAGANDGVGLSFFRVVFVPEKSLTLRATGTLALAGMAQAVDIAFVKDLSQAGRGAERDSTPGVTPENDDRDNPVANVHWLDVNKSFRALRVDRLGFLLQDNHVTVFLDAGFALSVLRMDFYGLFLSVPLAKEGAFGYGLQGLMIAFDKPPLGISGGLYKVPGEALFNGKASVRLGAFSLTALGSYGEMTSGKTTLFLYLMLSYPLGGPPCFFVTGLAAGFGINRKLSLPALKDVPRFPLVAAATKKGGGLDPGTKPADALNVLSDWITPSDGDYFITAGVAFTSFNLVDCFVLLSVAFGKNAQISLLGTAALSLPPQLAPDKNPIAYAGLALRALYDREEGNLEIQAALTAESYLLDKRCKLTGGFAFCAWTKGPYAGDFVITLGGCRHPNFRNRHYPAVDKLGINWQITSNLSLKGGAYFAAMPSGLMAGGDFELAYTSGGLKAWLRVMAEFYLLWKPFAYDITVSIALGASYTCKIFGIRVTLKVELSASLHLWGPDFSGQLKVKLFIFSITIGFGAGRSNPRPIGWDEFDKSFLPQNPPADARGQTAALGVDYANEGRRLTGITIADGLLAEDQAAGLALVSALRLAIATRSDMPVTALVLNGDAKHTYAGALGVAPMAVTHYTAMHAVTVETAAQTPVAMAALRWEPILNNVSTALWKNAPPDMNDDTLAQVPSGFSLRFAEQEPTITLPPGGGAYDLDVLTENECVFTAAFAWTRRARPPNAVPAGEDVYDAIRAGFRANAVRDRYLQSLRDTLGFEANVAVGRLGERPEDYFLARPVAVSTAADSVVFANGAPQGANA